VHYRKEHKKWGKQNWASTPLNKHVQINLKVIHEGQGFPPVAAIFVNSWLPKAFTISRCLLHTIFHPYGILAVLKFHSAICAIYICKLKSPDDGSSKRRCSNFTLSILHNNQSHMAMVSIFTIKNIEGPSHFYAYAFIPTH